jgi:hypothetical protein
MKPEIKNLTDAEHTAITADIRNAVAKSLNQTLGKPSEGAAVVEAMISGLALIIAMQSRGDQKTMSTLLDGASAHLFTRAADFQKLSQALAPRLKERNDRLEKGGPQK